MAIPVYLAMTAEEIHFTDNLPDKIAWMACHFSPYGTGLCNLPEKLPEKSLLILNDRTPIRRHDPNHVFDQLSERVAALNCSGILLDFENTCHQEGNAIIEKLTQLPCPVCVSKQSIGEFNLPVFLPPVPPQVPVEEYLAPWKKHKIWLEIAKSTTKISINRWGCTQTNLPQCDPLPHKDTMLNCHYKLSLHKESAEFILARTSQDITQLLQQSEQFPVERAIGLWQELKEMQKPLR